MFFILSKVLVFLIQPISWLVGLLGWALLTKNARRKRQLLRGTFWLTIVATNPFLFNTMAKAWEVPPTAMMRLRDTFDVAIVLGGFSSLDENAVDDRLNFNQAGNRLTDALHLYKKGLVRKILITGGDGRLMGKKSQEALITEPFLLAMGVRPDDILLEGKSRNTHENALFTKQLIDSQSLKADKLLLVTSAFHLKRSIACFEKVGLKVTPFAVHFEGKPMSYEPSRWLMPKGDGFEMWGLFIKEWIGYLAYKVKGYV